MKRRVLGLLLFLLIVPFFMGCDQMTTDTTTTVAETTTETAEETLTALGWITIEIVTQGDDPATTEVTEDEYVSNSMNVAFYEGDTLFDILNASFTITYEDSVYGRYLTGIDTLTPVGNEYVSFYINGSYAMTGVDDTVMEDGAVYQFKLETF